MSSFDIDLPACRGRQARLLAEMQKLQLDLVIVTHHEHVQWLAGPRIEWKFQPAAALAADGRLTLVVPGKQGKHVEITAAADEVTAYDAQLHSTLRNDQRAASTAVLAEALASAPRPRRVGVEFSCYGPHLVESLGGQAVDIEPRMYYLRRRKDPDELARLRHAIAATGKMYEEARRIVRPGVNELDVFNHLQGVAVRELGEMLHGGGNGTGNDFACCARGGPPRDRNAEAGELYILDLGPAFRGYFADDCRTLAVGGQPSDLQVRAWQHVMGVFPIVEQRVKPGQSCRALFEEVQAYMNEAPGGVFDHHLGHGIGLYPHEAPHLNPNWDDCFEEGDTFTAEPGLYGPELRAGLRLENDYLVTATVVENLSPFPMEL